MEIGKLPNDILQRIILDKLRNSRKEVLVRPGIGEDCCAVDFGEYACILSTDPVTGAENEVGRIAVHVSCNDIASSGVEPIGLMVTILAPPDATEAAVETVMEQISETAASLNVDIIGGHTEITGAVNRFVVMTTALGRILKDKLVASSGACAGDAIIVTKSIGIEGTAIIARDKEAYLKSVMDKQTVENAKSFINSISVVREGVIAGSFGVSAMHDVTEGGILGALWEIAEASGEGFRVHSSKIPVKKETKIICSHFGIDPLKLISSGSMLIACKDGDGLVRKLKDNGIESTLIGYMTESDERLLVCDESVVKVEQPGSDELYKVIGQAAGT